ncbi:MAG TPA: 2-succinyl-5-enolpyruvyl-6-hydroxy-3-cyclohexene-1-carboxylic-acid synthase [Baekduia sp.]
MSETRDTYLLLRAFVDELARCGVAGACTSPGSRSTPLVLSLARDGHLATTSHVDERSAGFFAVGLAKATGRPAVLACTSGTAAANYAPAVIEAAHSRLPLIVLTTDRPPELRDLGAGQTIDQIKLYGSAAKWFVEVGTHEATPQRLRWMRQLACRAVWTAMDGRAGPVHLNMALREPLVLDEELGDEPGGGGGRPGRAPWTARTTTEQDPATLVAWLREHRRGVIVAGREEPGAPAGAEHPVARLAAALAWPLLADPLSGARHGGAAIAHYDALLRDADWSNGVAPECVLRIGDLPTSKPLRQWLATLDGTEQVALLPGGDWHDPDATLSSVFDLRTPALAAIDEVRHTDPAWLGTWRDADARAARALSDTVGDDLNEPRVARELASAVPAGARVVVAASMPIRDVETFWPVDAPATALANRGANGIDGTISTAYGVAAGLPDAPVYLHIGDVALAHDLGGLLAGKRLGVPLTIVVVDNAGGGIFDFLPVATQRDAFEEHVLTPTGLEVERVAALFDAQYRAIDTVEALRAALAERPAGTTILHVRTVRADNVALHRRCWAAVTKALQRQ